MPEHLTTREVADHFGTVEWRVRRLFESGTLPEPPRFGGKRAIPRADLRQRGWLPEHVGGRA